MRAVNWGIIPFIVFISLALLLGRGLFLDPQTIPSAQIGKTLPHFQLPQLLNSQQIFTENMLPHQVLLLNVWASWCSACHQEQVFLLQLAAEKVLIYGLNYQDEPKAAKHWLKTWGNPYQNIVSDRDGHLAIDLGVYGAPETFLIDKKGLIRYKHVGILTKSIWEHKILPLKKILEAES